ncbi:MAG: hypothetical protein IKP18_02355, partial [Candidatus Methanomethylophilaceae archaeon]|nr:hypothetical protein [Candidatus Methanomethylophilaceae archaeon]
MEFEIANAFRSKGSILAIAAVLAIVVSCLAVSMPADAADDDKTLYIHGTLDASIIGSKLQVIVVDGDLAVENTQFIVANNTFIVNEGVTLTLKSGSYVKIASGSADIKGKVVCEEGTSAQPTFVVDSQASANISGIVTVNGQNGFVLLDGASANVSGDLTIAESGNATLNGVTVKNGGDLTINSAEPTFLGGVIAESGSNIAINGKATYSGMTNQDGSTFVVSSTG